MRKVISTDIDGLKLVLSDEERLRLELLVALYGTAYVEIKNGKASVIEPHIVAIMQQADKEEKPVMGIDWASDKDWSTEPDPKADLTKLIIDSLPIFRKVLLDGFDSEGKVWNEEERQEIQDAPLPEHDFGPHTIYLSKEEAEMLRKVDEH